VARLAGASFKPPRHVSSAPQSATSTPLAASSPPVLVGALAAGGTAAAGQLISKGARGGLVSSKSDGTGTVKGSVKPLSKGSVPAGQAAGADKPPIPAKSKVKPSKASGASLTPVAVIPNAFQPSPPAQQQAPAPGTGDATSSGAAPNDQNPSPAPHSVPVPAARKAATAFAPPAQPRAPPSKGNTSVLSAGTSSIPVASPHDVSALGTLNTTTSPAGRAAAKQPVAEAPKPAPASPDVMYDFPEPGPAPHRPLHFSQPSLESLPLHRLAKLVMGCDAPAEAPLAAHLLELAPSVQARRAMQALLMPTAASRGGGHSALLQPGGNQQQLRQVAGSFLSQALRSWAQPVSSLAGTVIVQQLREMRAAAEQPLATLIKPPVRAAPAPTIFPLCGSEWNMALQKDSSFVADASAAEQQDAAPCHLVSTQPQQAGVGGAGGDSGTAGATGREAEESRQLADGPQRMELSACPQQPVTATDAIRDPIITDSAASHSATAALLPGPAGGVQDAGELGGHDSVRAQDEEAAGDQAMQDHEGRLGVDDSSTPPLPAPTQLPSPAPAAFIASPDSGSHLHTPSSLRQPAAVPTAPAAHASKDPCELQDEEVGPLSVLPMQPTMLVCHLVMKPVQLPYNMSAVRQGGCLVPAL
jgi:hypothetical protein